MNYKKIKRVVALVLAVALLGVSVTGCSLFSKSTNRSDSSSDTESIGTGLDDLFTKRDLDPSYDEDSPKITFDADSIKSESDDATVSDNTVTITAKGTYILTGTSDDAQIVVDVDNEDKVQLVLDNLTLTSSKACALYVKQADKVFITLADDSHNSLTINSESETIDDKNVDGAIFARDDITINGSGSLDITSTKTNGIVGKDDVKIVGGEINITSAGHGVDANDSISIKEPTLIINADKDGLHCDANVNIVGGDINIAKSNEGIEGQVVNITGGEIVVVSSDDGINAASPDSSASDDPMASDDNAVLNISGGTIRVNAAGDGLDSNGAINISGGETYVSGPTNDGNTAIDFGSECIITGGTLIAAGSSGMVEAMSDKSTQGVMTVNASSSTGTITVTDSDGNVLAEYTPEKSYACVTISVPEFEVGDTYTIRCGETSEDITLSSTVVSNVSSGMGGMRGGPGAGGGMPGGQAPNGTVTRGQVPDGDITSGQAPNGNMKRGQAPDGNMMRGQAPGGKMTRGEAGNREVM